MGRGLVVVFASILLFACGGGGGDSAEVSIPTTPTRPEVLTGTVSKGLVRRANVEIFEIDSSGGTVRGLGTAQTDENGYFQSPIATAYGGGAVKVLATAVTNQTTMVCDVTPACGDVAFGSELALDPSFSLTALLPALETNTARININPFSDLAAARARELGLLTPTAIAAANSEVSNLLAGLDVLHSPAVNLADLDSLKDDITADSGIAVAVLNSALARLAFSQNITIPEMLLHLRTSFTGGTMAATRDVSNPNVIAMQDIVTAARQQLADLELRDTLGILADLQTDIDVAVSQGISLDPIASPNVGLTALERGRALVGDLRSWGHSIANSNTQADSFFTRHTPIVDLLFTSDYEFLATLFEAVDNVRDTLVATGAVDGSFTNQTVALLPAGVTVKVVSFPDGSKQAEITQQLSANVFNGRITIPPLGTVTDRVSLVISGIGFSRSQLGTFRRVDTTTTWKDVTYSIQFKEPKLLDITSLPPETEILSGVLAGKVILSVQPISPLGSSQGIPRTLFDGNVNLTVYPSGVMSNQTVLGSMQIGMQGVFVKENLLDFELAVNIEANMTRVLENNRLRQSGDFTASLTPKDTPDTGLQLTVAGRGYRIDDLLPVIDLVSANLTYQGKNLRIEASAPIVDPSLEVDHPKTVTATMTNQDGVRLVIAGASDTISSGDLVVDGVTIGTVTILSNAAGGVYKVSYIDGTFETIN